ncbi:LAMI_0F06260g1_1 [Lachancea mirantina]|uniref:DNA-directed DNA polymerase n=1 Tax=Lachancea mirantina TaxID=1230905 RepID=A0A1G4JYU4_9SACH|nr:LAMI_0F06260g1_1 [Lachancea mirantina]
MRLYRRSIWLQRPVIRHFSPSERKSYSTGEKLRLNAVGIQHLSAHLHKQVFGRNSNPSQQESHESQHKDLERLSKQFLRHHGLLGKTSVSKPISFDVPELQGNSLDEHFQKLGQFAAYPYLDMARNKFTKLVRRPERWILRSGWIRYEPGKDPEPVPRPEEDTMVFDVETLYKIGPYPTLAVAVSKNAWYCWCSPYLCGDESIVHLIPVGTHERPKLVIGHNVGYDRARVLEEYNLQESKAFFLDTMSLHVASSGMCARQRPRWVKSQKAMNEESSDNDNETTDYDKDLEDPWLSVSTANSLKDVALLHCNINMDKDKRDAFSTLDKQNIVNDFNELVDYCATDVEVTSKVFDKIFPLFLQKCPHPVSFGALKFLSSSFLTTRASEWFDYINRSETIYQESKNLVEDKLISIIEEIVKLKDDMGSVNRDPWLKQLDWTLKPLRLTKKGEPHKNQKLPGYPEWYRSLFPTKDTEKPQISIRTRLIPIFFRLSWEGSPVVWHADHGWCFSVPYHLKKEFEAKNYICVRDLKDTNENESVFKIPHPNGQQFKCTTLLSKPYIHFFEKGVLTSGSELAHEALQINSSGSYWMSARERIMSQFVVPKKCAPSEFKGLTGDKIENDEVSIILPALIPMGTVTRRSVENTWLTASNAKSNRIGSELKAQIKAPKNYCFVGADVDSEELWIASLVSDSVFGLHGGTPIGWMCLEGSKASGTDMHSKTASILNCSRSEAKIFNYGRIYGAGMKFASQLLKKFNPGITDEEAKLTAERLYASTKGTIQHSKTFKKFWFGGSESILFNKLEGIAEQKEPRTPVLGAGITNSLTKSNLGKSSFLPSRINWAIQSSGVDYLHLLCCSMNYLIKKYSLRARLALSIHDEIRFLAAKEDKYRVAMALQISNLWTRAIFCEQMGISDLPQNCAFFSAVDIDHVLRKEVDMDCITPSNKEAIPHGVSLSIKELLEKPESSLGDPNPKIDVTQFSYNIRERVLKACDKEYTDHFLDSFLKIQIQTAKWKVDELEQAFRREFANKALKTQFSDTDEISLQEYMDGVQQDDPQRAGLAQTSAHGNVIELRASDALGPFSNLRDQAKIAAWNTRASTFDLESQHLVSAKEGLDASAIKASRLGTCIKTRRNKRVIGGTNAYTAFEQCMNKPRSYVDTVQKALSAIDVDTVVKNVVEGKAVPEKRAKSANPAKLVGSTKKRAKNPCTTKAESRFKTTNEKEFGGSFPRRTLKTSDTSLASNGL